MKRVSALMVCCWAGLLSVGEGLAQQSKPEFVVKPSEVAIPEGVEIGKFRRMIQPFENWTLVCDENLQKMQKICNLSQQIGLKSGGVVFSWALTTSEIGMPLMLARLPAATGLGKPVHLYFDKAREPFKALIDECSQQFCTAVIPVGPQMKRHIHEGLDVGIAFSVPGVGTIEFKAPMAGLSKALAAIN